MGVGRPARAASETVSDSTVITLLILSVCFGKRTTLSIEDSIQNKFNSRI